MPENSEIPLYKENLQKAIKNIRIADHMIYVTYPVIKDKRLLLKGLEQVHEALTQVINAILQYDYLFKRIQLSKDPRANFDSFISKCAARYNINSEEINSVIELFTLAESHKKSPLEFMRRERIVIMSDNLKTVSLDSDRLKKYLNLSKSLVNKAKFGMSI